MAHIRKLPSGRYQAIVKHPSGRQITHSHLLRKVVAEWAREQESALARGTWVDSAAGRVTLTDWHRTWLSARVVSEATTRRNETHWRLHVQPAWGSWPIGTIRSMDIGAWVKRMVAAGVGPPTVHACVNLLSSLLAAAADESLIPRNPAKGVALPTIVARPPEWFTRGEHDQLLEVLDEPHRTFVAFSCTVGLRWGEATALRGSEVDWLRGQASVWRVQTRWGLREYPKSRRSRRVVPVPPHLLEAMSRLMADRDRSELLFAAPDGGAMEGSNFRRRVWTPALAGARLPYRRPNVMRHTAATWLVQAGVDLYRVQALLGHEDFRTTMRYAHHAPDVDEAVLAAWQGMDFQDHGAPGVHDSKKPRRP